MQGIWTSSNVDSDFQGNFAFTSLPGLGGATGVTGGRMVRLILSLLAALATVPVSAAERVPRVEVALARSAALSQEATLAGSVAATRSARVTTAIAGRIVRLPVEVGDRVRAGQTLAELDAELIKLELAVAKAAVAEERARVNEAQRRLAEAETLAGRAIPANQVAVRAAELDTARAALARREAERALRAGQIARHTIRAPFAGLVTARAAEEGEWLTPGVSLLDLVDTRTLRLEFQVPQRYFGRIGKDATLRVKLDNETRWRDARIDSVVQASDATARTFLLLATLAGAPPLLPGMSARATLTMPTGTQGVAVPRDALNRYPDGRVTVWQVETRGGKPRVRERRVTLADGFARDLMAVQGLKGGETLVVRGNEALRHDMVVEVVRR